MEYRKRKINNNSGKVDGSKGRKIECVCGKMDAEKSLSRWYILQSIKMKRKTHMENGKNYEKFRKYSHSSYSRI